MLNEEVFEILNDLTEHGKIYLLSKMVGITIGCSEVKEGVDTEKLMFSTASSMIICSIAENRMTANDRVMVDTFITECVKVPENIVSIINQSIESCKMEGAQVEPDVMYV